MAPRPFGSRLLPLVRRVSEYWIVDPRRRTVEVCRLVDDAYAEPEVFTAGRIRSSVLPDLEASVDDVFAGLD